MFILGPIPVSITWDEIRNTFYSRVSRNQILHTYVQSKPVNDVVYGQVVFDKTSLANKMLKEGPIKVPKQQQCFFFIQNFCFKIWTRIRIFSYILDPYADSDSNPKQL